jgi:transposase-like protein
MTAEDLKQVLREDRDLLKVIVEEVLQQVLEAEMDEALQAGKGERTASRLGYRSGHYSRTLVTRVGKIALQVPQDRQEGSERKCSSAINGARRRWSQP